MASVQRQNFSSKRYFYEWEEQHFLHQFYCGTHKPLSNKACTSQHYFWMQQPTTGQNHSMYPWNHNQAYSCIDVWLRYSADISWAAVIHSAPFWRWAHPCLLKIPTHGSGVIQLLWLAVEHWPPQNMTDGRDGTRLLERVRLRRNAEAHKARSSWDSAAHPGHPNTDQCSMGPNRNSCISSQWANSSTSLSC